MGNKLGPSIKLALVVLTIAIGISLLTVGSKQELAEFATPALQWSRHQWDWLLRWLPISSGGGNAAENGVSQLPTHDDFELAACQMKGTVADCACTYGAVEKVNRDELWPTLSQLVTTPFFRYFKVNLYCDCPIWPDEGMCSMKDCCVHECEESEIPAPWREDEQKRAAALSQLCGEGEAEGGLDRQVDSGVAQKLKSIRGWHGLDNPWVPEGDEAVEYVYVDLLKNPEKYTGYKGEDARRVWAAIYAQSCFKDLDGPATCKEKQVFFRLISGMHSSITAHICHNFYDEESETWGPNLPLFKARLGNPGAAPYVENLYFAYLFVLRAVIKAGPVLQSYNYDTGAPEQDAQSRALVSALVGNVGLRTACPTPFDEGLLWKREEAVALKEQLRSHFHNITNIMNCVGCEKCKMWGKLQILGIATSLKILFECDDHNDLMLDRNEVIALINLLGRLSDSVETVRELSLALQQQERGQAADPGEVGAIRDQIVSKSEDVAPGR